VAEGQEFEPLDVAKVSPFIVENHEIAGFLLNSVVCEELTRKISTSPFAGCPELPPESEKDGHWIEAFSLF
jgi:hypothetical protein